MDDPLTLLEDRVRHLEDGRQILRTLHDYCTSFDQDRPDAWVDCFTEDAVLIYEGGLGPDGGKRPPRKFTGRSQLNEFIRNIPTVQRQSMPKHFSADAIINTKGNEATVESVVALIIDVNGAPELISTGRYLDRLRRCSDGRWRFCERLGHIDTLKYPPTPH